MQTVQKNLLGHLWRWSKISCSHRLRHSCKAQQLCLDATIAAAGKDMHACEVHRFCVTVAIAHFVCSCCSWLPSSTSGDWDSLGVLPPMASHRTQGKCMLCCDKLWPCHICLLTALGALLPLQGVITDVRPQPRMQGAQLAKPNVCSIANRRQV